MESKSKEKYVLVVDDEDVIRSLFIDLLTERGYKVIAVKNGQQAIEKAREISFTIAFIDMHMPVINGIQTLRAIKKIKPQTRIVMMDSYPNALLEQAGSAGALTCIHKPFEIKEVIGIIEEFEEQKIKV